MNILFQTCGKLNPIAGGTERTTITVATELKARYGCRCYSVYERAASTAMVDCIDGEYRWTIVRDEAQNAAALRQVIEQWHIDVIIVQGAFIHVKRFRQAIEGMNCRLIFAHHYEPGAETGYFNISSVLNKKPKSLRAACRWIYNIALYPLARKQYVDALSQQYREAYANADDVVLLSESFIKPFQKFGKIDNADKFSIIPNALSLDEFFPVENLDQKQKTVLIVSRLDEVHKKISVALEIWRRVKLHAASAEWQLQIVGEGAAARMLHTMVEHKHIPDVAFLGRQVPNAYYRQASIFMMTSKSESWGLTLTEAQQMGVVPVALDTYPSLHDIITNGVDGLIVAKDDIDGYAANMLALMTDADRRHRLAANGLKSCLRFTPATVVSHWWHLITTNK
jgi:glycosyltransferase involved in cell wall biosynthesis